MGSFKKGKNVNGSKDKEKRIKDGSDFQIALCFLIFSPSSQLR
jgi:hypothetical protein